MNAIAVAGVLSPRWETCVIIYHVVAALLNAVTDRTEMSAFARARVCPRHLLASHDECQEAAFADFIDAKPRARDHAEQKVQGVGPTRRLCERTSDLLVIGQEVAEVGD